MERSMQSLTANDLQEFKIGSSAAFNKIERAFYQSVFYFAWKLLGNKEDAEDITQNTFVKLWNLKGNFETEANIKAFLFITARNECLNNIRQGNKQTSLKTELLKITKEDEDNILHAMVDQETTQAIHKSIERMPGRPGEVLRLSLYKQLNTKEIAEQLGIAPNTVIQSRKRALQILKNDLINRKIISLILLLFSYPFAALINLLKKILN